ncbi:hypothetical protein SprV_0702290300 [Sparganum proliferum]
MWVGLPLAYREDEDDEADVQEEKPIAVLAKRWSRLHAFFKKDEIGMKMTELKMKIQELACCIHKRMREQLKLKLKELLKED